MHLKFAGWNTPALALLLVVISEGFTAHAATTDDWTNTSSGLWLTHSNWSDYVPPNAGFSLITLTNAGTKTVTIDGATPAENLSIQKLTVSAPVGSLNTLELVDATLTNALQVSGTLVIDAGGLIRVTNSALGAGILALTGGALKLDSGFVDCSPATAVKLSSGDGVPGTIEINGGMMSVDQLQVGAVAGSEGVVSMSNGVLNAASLVSLGQAFNSTGAVNIAGGSLLVTNDLTKVGNLGTGHVRISGGSANFAFLSMGENEGASGTVDITGGEMKITPRDETDLLRVGSRGLGQLNISGGTHTVGSEFHLADWANATGLVSVVGGQLIATNARTAVGRLGFGQMVVSNAFVQLTNASVGRHVGAIGFLMVQSNGIVAQIDDLSIGRFAGAEGHVIVDGGMLALTNENVWVGREGTGELTINSGTVSARAFFIGMSPDGSNAPAGTLTMGNGLLVASSNIVVGTPLLSAGQVVVSGGKVVLTGKDGPGYVVVNNGSFNVANADASLGDLLVTNTAGQVTFSSGTLRLKNATVANGAAFVVGDGVNTARLELLGGTFSFANGLVVSPNATITGCGTILGEIVNNGTIATNCSTGQNVVIATSSSPQAGGTTTGSGTYVSGASVTVTAAPGPGFLFVNWTENGTAVSSSPTYSFIAATNHTLVANFLPDSAFPVTVELNGIVPSVSFASRLGLTYVLEYKDTLNDVDWIAILPGTPGTGERMSLADPAPTSPARFYRVRAN